MDDVETQWVMGILQRHSMGTFRKNIHRIPSLRPEKTNFEEFFRAFVWDMWVKNHQLKEYLRNVQYRQYRFFRFYSK